jgi:Skp family chaperone for outer membrane proteins
MLEASKPSKINGFDRWDVEQWARTLKDAEELQGDAKKLAAATKQLKKEQEENAKTIKSLKKAERNAKKNLKKVFGKKT